jgi:hypothetical protein
MEISMAGPNKPELRRRVRDLEARNIGLLEANLSYAEGVVLRTKDLRQTEKKFPNWSLGINFETEVPQKYFVRRLPDLVPHLKNNPDLVGGLLISSVLRDGLGTIFGTPKAVNVLLPGQDEGMDGQLEIWQPTGLVCLTRYDALAVGMADALLCNLDIVAPAATDLNSAQPS